MVIGVSLGLLQNRWYHWVLHHPKGWFCEGWRHPFVGMGDIKKEASLPPRELLLDGLSILIYRLTRNETGLVDVVETTSDAEKDAGLTERNGDGVTDAN